MYNIRKKEKLTIIILSFMLILTFLVKSFSQESDEDSAKSDTEVVKVKPVLISEKPANIAEGKKIYEISCASCHGISGDGEGTTSYFINPKAINFKFGVFNFRSTPSGEVPTDDDLYLIIKSGIPSTQMPAWGLLGEGRIRNVVAYIKTFSEYFKDGPPDRIKFGNPVPYTRDSVIKGRQVFLRAKCWGCHGYNGRGDGPSSFNLRNEATGIVYKPIDLTKKWKYKYGYMPANIIRTFSAGLDRTPMWAYEGIFSNEDGWNLANYVSSLARRD